MRYFCVIYITSEHVSLDVIFLQPFVVQDNELDVAMVQFWTQICSSLRNASRTKQTHVSTIFRAALAGLH